MPNDLLVKLYNLQPDTAMDARLSAAGIQIKRALVIDAPTVLDFVAQNFSAGWVEECRAAILQHKCYIAVCDGKIIGFSCADATIRGFFGPIGLAESARGHGVGKALLYHSLLMMKEAGFGYAIIGWVTEALPFYQKCLPGVLIIPDSHPGAYGNLICFSN